MRRLRNWKNSNVGKVSETKITIPQIPPSLNKFAGRNNVWAYRKAKEEWKQSVCLLARCIKHTTYEKAIVTITYYFPTKARHDPDNYAGKVILDGLTEAGIIADDSFACIELRLRGDYDKVNPRTEIEIVEALI